MKKSVWVFIFLLCWWVVGSVPLENSIASGAHHLSDRHGAIKEKLMNLQGPVETESSTAEKKKIENPEQHRRREPKKKKSSTSPVHHKKKQKRPVIYYQGPNDQKRIALTFDDGPDWKYTARILDILKREKVRATFFLVGRMAEQRPDLVRRMVREGHVVANHTWNHPNLPQLKSQRVRQEVNRTNRVVSEIAGRTPMLFRAPYGSLNRRVERLLDKEGMIIVHWNVDTRDWDGRSSYRIIRTVRQYSGPGSVVLQHTAGRNLNNTVKALPRIIADLKKRGYTLVTVPELLDVPAYKEEAIYRCGPGLIRPLLEEKCAIIIERMRVRTRGGKGVKIIGIDPGIAIVGYGVLEQQGNRLIPLDYGCIRTESSWSLPARLKRIYDEVGDLFQQYNPDVVAAEKLFFNRNVTTAFTVGQARGVILLASEEARVPVTEYTPLQVKMAVVGYGQAEKRQVQEMVRLLLSLSTIPKPDDAADALAIAICQAHSSTGLARLEGGGWV